MSLAAELLLLFEWLPPFSKGWSPRAGLLSRDLLISLCRGRWGLCGSSGGSSSSGLLIRGVTRSSSEASGRDGFKGGTPSLSSSDECDFCFIRCGLGLTAGLPGRGGTGGFSSLRYELSDSNLRFLLCTAFGDDLAACGEPGSGLSDLESLSLI